MQGLYSGIDPSGQGRGGGEERGCLTSPLLCFLKKKKLEQIDHVGKIGQLFLQCLVSDGQGLGEEERTKDAGLPV